MKVHLEFVKKIILVIKSRSNLRQKTYKSILCETYDLMALRSFKKSFLSLITSMKKYVKKEFVFTFNIYQYISYTY